MRNGDWTEETERQAENAIGYSFRDKRLLKQCFTHTTYANAKGCDHNERLEFLGDAVVGLYVTEELYRNTKSGEGKLTDLRKNYVSEEALNAAAEKAGLMQFLLVSGKHRKENAFQPVRSGCRGHFFRRRQKARERVSFPLYYRSKNGKRDQRIARVRAGDHACEFAAVYRLRVEKGTLSLHGIRIGRSCGRQRRNQTGGKDASRQKSA